MQVERKVQALLAFFACCQKVHSEVHKVTMFTQKFNVFSTLHTQFYCDIYAS